MDGVAATTIGSAGLGLSYVEAIGLERNGSSSMVAIGSGISAASCGKEWKLGVLTSQKSRKQQGDGGGRIEGGRKRRRAEERSAAWRRDDELRSRSGSRGWWWRREYDRYDSGTELVHEGVVFVSLDARTKGGSRSRRD